MKNIVNAKKRVRIERDKNIRGFVTRFDKIKLLRAKSLILCKEGIYLLR